MSCVCFFVLYRYSFLGLLSSLLFYDYLSYMYVVCYTHPLFMYIAHCTCTCTLTILSDPTVTHNHLSSSSSMSIISVFNSRNVARGVRLHEQISSVEHAVSRHVQHTCVGTCNVTSRTRNILFTYTIYTCTCFALNERYTVYMYSTCKYL